MKRILFCFLFALSVGMCCSQDIEVVEFKQLETDLTANTTGTIVLDQNGEKCALIKVATSQTDFSFDAGMMGVVKTVQKNGEIWVYVPAGVKRLSISHAGMESLRDHDLGMSLQKAQTYLLTLKTKKDVVLQTVNFSVKPANATIMIESSDPASDFGRKSVVLSNGSASLKIPIGNYKYTAIAPGYIIEDGMFSLVAQSQRNVLLQLVPETGTAPSTAPSPAVAQTPTTTTPADQCVPPVLGTVSPSAPVKSETISVKGVSFKMILVDGGTFNMGYTSEQTGLADEEKPVHSVTLDSFHIGETEVTQELWKAVMGKNPSHFKKSNQNPVETISWQDCQEFIQKLNSLTGMKFRLPTEAEWEYAARGGNRSKGYRFSGSDNVDEVAWYKGNAYEVIYAGVASHEVKSKKPNELGIYDMSGNVWEWCQDWFGNYSPETVTNPTGPSTPKKQRVVRGGSLTNNGTTSSCANRGGNLPTDEFNTLGFRLAL